MQTVRSHEPVLLPQVVVTHRPPRLLGLALSVCGVARVQQDAKSSCLLSFEG